MNYYPPLRRAKAGNRLQEPRVQVTVRVLLSRGRGSAEAQPVRDTGLGGVRLPWSTLEERSWASSGARAVPLSLRGRSPLSTCILWAGGAVSAVGEPRVSPGPEPGRGVSRWTGCGWPSFKTGRQVARRGTVGGLVAPGGSLRWLLTESGLTPLLDAGLAPAHRAAWLVPARGGGPVLVGGAPTEAA